MLGFERRVEGYRKWAQRTPAFHRPLLYVLNILIILIGVGSIVHLPVQVLATILKVATHRGPNGHDFIELTTNMKLIMAASLTIVLVLSGMIAGFMRSLYRGGMLDNWWSIVGSLPFMLAMFLYLGHVIRSVSNALGGVGGDTPLLIAYLTAWLLLLGYVSKVPWDELRDRCASICDHKWELWHYWAGNKQKS